MNRKGHTLSKPSSLKQLMLGTPGVHSSREISGASGDPVCPSPVPAPSASLLQAQWQLHVTQGNLCWNHGRQFTSGLLTSSVAWITFTVHTALPDKVYIFGAQSWDLGRCPCCPWNPIPRELHRLKCIQGGPMMGPRRV